MLVGHFANSNPQDADSSSAWPPSYQGSHARKLNPLAGHQNEGGPWQRRSLHLFQPLDVLICHVLLIQSFGFLYSAEMRDNVKYERRY